MYTKTIKLHFAFILKVIYYVRFVSIYLYSLSTIFQKSVNVVPYKGNRKQKPQQKMITNKIFIIHFQIVIDKLSIMNSKANNKRSNTYYKSKLILFLSVYGNRSKSKL